MDDQLRTQVRQRAGGRCEYCSLPQSSLPYSTFHVDHVIPNQHGGSDELNNLALCCSRCNLSKGPNLSGIDIATGAMVRLFNPRIDTWRDHFGFQGAIIVGRTPIGRVTVQVLNMNEDRRVQLRVTLLQAQRRH